MAITLSLLCVFAWALDSPPSSGAPAIRELSHKRFRGGSFPRKVQIEGEAGRHPDRFVACNLYRSFPTLTVPPSDSENMQMVVVRSLDIHRNL
jgi:hypothetical protein